MYDTCKETVEAEPSQTEYYASTTDIWSSQKREPCLSLTVHFLSTDFELKTQCPLMAYFPVERTGENLACGLRTTLTGWHLWEVKLVCITTDKETNIVKATELNCHVMTSFV